MTTTTATKTQADYEAELYRLAIAWRTPGVPLAEQWRIQDQVEVVVEQAFDAGFEDLPFWQIDERARVALYGTGTDWLHA